MTLLISCRGTSPIIFVYEQCLACVKRMSKLNLRELNPAYAFDPVKSKIHSRSLMNQWQMAIDERDREEREMVANEIAKEQKKYTTTTNKGGIKHTVIHSSVPEPKPKREQKKIEKPRTLKPSKENVKRQNAIRVLKNKIAKAEEKEKKIEMELEKARTVTKNAKEELSRYT